MADMVKAEPAPGYPPEEGCYLRGNDYSPVAVVVILRWAREETPEDIEHLVRVGLESGAALSGTLQTENIGLEKVICNVVSNPNIRYLIVCGPESPGHLVGESIAALMKNGLDDRKRIVGTSAPTPYLYNIPAEYVERFRKQVALVNLTNEGSPDVLRQAVWSCYQEDPTAFRSDLLQDPGAYPEPPLDGKITWRIREPYKEPRDEEERRHLRKAEALVERIRKSVEARRHERGGREPQAT
ncbi:MAG TPA: tetrahydromethanopterin S-methyltransferase subunit A [Planctomycetota bacterium]|nr:tetrahydromethanopterin S-methyltransferase subunit A [Planctomycetota bacterium]